MTTISVVTAVYNRAATVGEALDSVLSQVSADVEPVVIDGASNDGTLEVIEPYRPRLSVCISEPDSGVYDALNKGIEQSRGDVIGFLHADDLFADNRVLERIGLAFERTGADAVYGDLVYVDKNDPLRVVRYWQAGSYRKDRLLSGWMPPHPTFYVKRSVYERLGVFDTRYRIAADYDSILRFLFVAGIDVAYVPEVLVRMRTGGLSNRSLSTITRKSREDYLILKRNGVGGLATLLSKNVGKLGQFWNRPDTSKVDITEG